METWRVQEELNKKLEIIRTLSNLLTNRMDDESRKIILAKIISVVETI